MALAAWLTSIIMARWKLEVGDGAGYGVHTVIVGERPAVFGDVGELVEEGVVAVLGRHVIQQEAPPISLARHVTAVAKFLLVAIERKLRPANFAS
jgi:hypothetical protein